MIDGFMTTSILTIRRLGCRNTRHKKERDRNDLVLQKCAQK